MLFLKPLALHSIFRDLKIYFGTAASISVISTLMLMFISFFDATNAIGKSISISYGFVEISMHFLAFFYTTTLVTVTFLVSRIVGSFIFLRPFVRISLILVWGFLWMLRIYFSVLIQGRLEPSPSISYPTLVIIPVAIVSILALEMLLPPPKLKH